MSAPKQATLYRMVMPGHTCLRAEVARSAQPQGLRGRGQTLASREQTDAFKKEHGVETTPQVFINGRRVGGYDDLRKFFGMSVKDKNAVTYTPVIALFAMAAAMALAASWASASSGAFRRQSGSWPLPCVSWRCRSSRTWTASRRCSSTTTCWPSAGFGMPISTRSRSHRRRPDGRGRGDVGVDSVGAVHRDRRGRVGFKAVYVDRRELKCACVGGDSNVPLGFVLTENLMMVAMALWMWAKVATLDTLSTAPGGAAHVLASAVLCRPATTRFTGARGGPASLRAAAICSCEAEVWTSTRRVGGSVTILALGSIVWIVFVRCGRSRRRSCLREELHGKLLSGWGV